jgi:hypothetical protein
VEDLDMSVLDYPRIHFKGCCWVNPATGNNNTVTVNLDTVNVALAQPLLGMSDAEARAWMIESFQAKNTINNGLFWYVKGGWNYYGDMSFKLEDVVVTAVTALDGSSDPDDDLIGEPVEIRGTPFPDDEEKDSWAVVCDLDPMGALLTQLFLGQFSVGSSSLGLSATCDLRAFGRWVIWRNSTIYNGEQNFPGAGATWQFAIPKNDLEFYGDDSEVLNSLYKAADKAKGIVVQFALYLPVPSICDDKLIARFRTGEHLMNPVKCLLVGTIGVWNEQELQTSPAGRRLLPARATVIGPGMAKLHSDRNIVSLNLISTFPEADYIRPPAKYDWGEVVLGLVSSSGTVLPISGPIAYDYSTYETFGGIVDVPYDPSSLPNNAFDTGSLALLIDRGGLTPLISEAGSTVTVETDDRGVYLTVNDSGQVGVLIRERGGPPSRDVNVYLWEFQYYLTPEDWQKRATAEMALLGSKPNMQSRVWFPHQVKYPANGTDPETVSIKALRPGTVALAMTLDDQAPSPLSLGLSVPYAGVRVLPQDDYSNLPTDQITWKCIYNLIWRYYYIVYPAMSDLIDFSDQSVMEKYAHKLAGRTDPNCKASTHYMPITRELSKGKQELIARWASTFP